MEQMNETTPTRPRMDDDFKNFYQQAILPELKNLSELKKKIRSQSETLGFSIAGIVVVLIVLMVVVGAPFAILHIAAIGVAAFFGVKKQYIVKPKLKKVKAGYKKSIFFPIFQYFYPEVLYIPDRGFGVKSLRRSKLFHPQPDNTFEAEDYVKVEVGDTNVQFCEISFRTTDKEKRQQNGFRGILCVAEFNKSFSKETIVLSKKGMSAYEHLKFGLKSVFDKEDFAELESVEFAKHFVVLTEDQIEARYLLTTSLMQRILDYQKKLRSPISLSFIQNKLYMKVPVEKDLFDFDLDSSFDKYREIAQHTKYFLLLTDIVYYLNLNNQIWKKA